MLALTKSSPGLRRLGLLLVLGIIFGSLSSLFVYRRASLDFAAEQGRAIQQFLKSSSHGQQGEGAAIPAIVHFVQLKKDPDATLHFSFEAFLVLYASHYHVSPTAIYIHHDFSHEEIEHAKQHGSSWTRKVLTFPSVRLNSVTAPTEANGHSVDLVEHKSDFIRLKALRQHGGIYMDWDVIPIHSLTPVRHAGFQTVVGRQFDRTINNGILLATPQSAVIRIMDDETQRVFDGYWITHSTTLLTRVANRLAAAAGEVLIMDHRAFEPFSWEQPDVHALLGRHDGDGVPEPAAASPNSTTPDELWATLESAEGQKDWAYDFSDTLFVHKIFNDVDTPPGFEGVNVPYIKARDSNYALATWPILMEAIKNGVIDPNDDTY